MKKRDAVEAASNTAALGVTGRLAPTNQPQFREQTEEDTSLFIDRPWLRDDLELGVVVITQADIEARKCEIAGDSDA